MNSFVLREKTVGAYQANADFEQAFQAFLANKDRNIIGKEEGMHASSWGGASKGHKNPFPIDISVENC